MKKQLSGLALLLLSFTARQALPENMKTEECRIPLPGITFTRSLNQYFFGPTIIAETRSWAKNALSWSLASGTPATS